jgi:putative mycofactocin binding protein MftB
MDAPWRLARQVSVRPERFGALLYHFGTRRLSFLKSRALLDVVVGLRDCDSATECCLRAGVPADDLAAYRAALATLARSGMIEEGTRP